MAEREEIGVTSALSHLPLRHSKQTDNLFRRSAHGLPITYSFTTFILLLLSTHNLITAELQRILSVMDASKAPKAKPSSDRLKKGFEKLAQDKEALEQFKANAEESTWFDADAPGTRKRRETVRANFEDCIRSVYEKEE